jgi:hypothetical protein
MRHLLPLSMTVVAGDDSGMKNALVLVAVFVGLAGLRKLLGSRLHNIDWEKRIASLPDNAPPKWMFRNITAIRENTERILRLLESERSGPTQPVPAPPPG